MKIRVTPLNPLLAQEGKLIIPPLKIRGLGGVMKCNFRSTQKGFTLIEVIMVIVLLGIMLPGIMMYFIQGVKDSADSQRRTTAIFLAEGLMEEIRSKRWDEVAVINANCNNATLPLAAEEATRDFYDDIDDFNAVVNVTPPQNSQGASLGAAYQGFSQTVSVMYVGPPPASLDIDAAARTCYKRIRVDITDTGTTETISLVSLMTSY